MCRLCDEGKPQDHTAPPRGSRRKFLKTSAAAGVAVGGVNLFAACTVAKVPIERLIRPLLPFVGVVLACLMVITYWPDLSLYFRDLVYR